ncbi:hypothetical protein TVAGG3_0464870 [Trichomonas vaginalis G3]|uniref:hypothetical protein n=1 Tax=Trichomonas vaginalis (strain ATCC PRA-98 / G3) TaxID=412133 RepID=UPI0021E622A2|nr:hypothetical protein TVAGG3_0464870 [Trichomonas vaginalis G3]KAI5514693.1 hypothetical protein TVAGG3_0464870 [Trichomonas vaginalis G3]
MSEQTYRSSSGFQVHNQTPIRHKLKLKFNQKNCRKSNKPQSSCFSPIRNLQSDTIEAQLVHTKNSTLYRTRSGLPHSQQQKQGYRRLIADYPNNLSLTDNNDYDRYYPKV